MIESSRLLDDAVIELLREDPAFADKYLSAALDEINQPGGREAFLAVLRHIAEAQGMATVAVRAGMPRKPMPRIIEKRQSDTKLYWP
jgi:DNA-binding phage protein